MIIDEYLIERIKENPKSECHKIINLYLNGMEETEFREWDIHHLDKLEELYALIITLNELKLINTHLIE